MCVAQTGQDRDLHRAGRGGCSGSHWGPSARFPDCRVLRSPSTLLLSLSA